MTLERAAVLVSAEDSRGAWSGLSCVAAGGAPSAQHVHPGQTESF